MAALLDMYGNPIKKEALKQEEATCVISGVRSHDSNYPSYGLTPVKLGRILHAADQGDIDAYLDLAEEMEEKEIQYQTVLGTRKRAVIMQDISVEPAGEDAAAQKHADFIQSFIDTGVLDQSLFDILDAVGKGFSVSEIMWDCSENQWMPERIEYINPKWFKFDKNMKTLLLKTQDDAKPLTPYKFITAQIKAKSGLPIRSGLAKIVSWYFTFKNFDIKSWITFLEVYGQPLRVGKYGTGATKEDKETLLKAVYNVGADTAAIIPESMVIDFVAAQQSGSSDMYERFASYVDLAISKAVLGQTTTTDAVSGGHAVSKEHNEVRHDIMWSDIKQLQTIFMRDLVRPIIDLNFGPQKAYPKIKIGTEEKEDISALTDSLSKLVPMGLKVSASQMRAKLGLEPPKDDDDVLAYQAPAFPTAFNQVQKSLNEARPGKKDAIEQAADELAGEWEALTEPMLRPIEDILAECTSYEEAFVRLAEAYPQMDVSALTESLAKTSFKARLNGRLKHE